MTRKRISPEQTVIGGEDNFWLYSKATGYDLTHAPSPESAPVNPHIPLKTINDEIKIDPAKTALFVVDMTNFFHSPALGRPVPGHGAPVVEKLSKIVIPARRRANIPIIWSSFGCNEEELRTMPPTVANGFKLDPNHTERPSRYGLGQDLGKVVLEDGTEVEAGRALMRDTWNTELIPSLAQLRQEDDMFLYKSLYSAFVGESETARELRKRGIRTLLFAGCNTDACVANSIQGAFQSGFDCLLLRDACNTFMPRLAQDFVEWACSFGWGFNLTSEQFAEGVEKMKTDLDGERTLESIAQDG